METKPTYAVYRREVQESTPGMFRNAGHAIEFLASLVLLVAVMIGAIIGIVYIFTHHHAGFMKWYCFAVFGGMSAFFASVARRRTESRLTRCMCSVGSVWAAVVALFSSGVL